MLTLWMGYAVLVGLVVTGAASLLERGLLARRRWLWAGAQLLAVLLPLVRPALRRLGAATGAVDVVFGPIGPAVRDALPSLDALATRAATSAGLTSLQGPLSGAWIGASLVLAAFVLAGLLRVRRLRRAWRSETLDGTPVLVSGSLGPAVVGVVRPVVVLPEWVLGLPAAERTMILAHEEEHRRAGDPRLLAAALVLPVVMPWNPAAWLGFLRLRDAVETDCDARVLARSGGKPSRYARLLFEVGTRTAGAIPVGAGFGERSSSLERRIRAILGTGMRFGWKGLALRGGVAVLLVTAACSLEINIDSKPDDQGASAPTAAVADPAPSSSGAPTAAALPEAPEAPSAPTPGEATIDRVDRIIQRPATPVVATGAAPAPTGAPVESAPTFTPFTVAPSIMNREEVIRAMTDEYPPLLRDAGIGGSVKVYFFIDADGKVQDTRIDQSSGHQALDEAALRVASIYRFSPALNKDRKVPVWVSFPITFQVR